MRINVYAEELTDRVELVEKPDAKTGQVFTGLRLYTMLPATTADGKQVQGPFIHHTGDDATAAVTFWGKQALREILRKSLALLDIHYGEADGLKQIQQLVASLPEGAMGYEPSNAPPYKQDRIPLVLNALSSFIAKTEANRKVREVTEE